MISQLLQPVAIFGYHWTALPWQAKMLPLFNKMTRALKLATPVLVARRIVFHITTLMVGRLSHSTLYLTTGTGGFYWTWASCCTDGVAIGYGVWQQAANLDHFSPMPVSDFRFSMLLSDIAQITNVKFGNFNPKTNDMGFITLDVNEVESDGIKVETFSCTEYCGTKVMLVGPGVVMRRCECTWWPLPSFVVVVVKASKWDVQGPFNGVGWVANHNLVYRRHVENAQVMTIAVGVEALWALACQLQLRWSYLSPP